MKKIVFAVALSISPVIASAGDSVLPAGTAGYAGMASGGVTRVWWECGTPVDNGSCAQPRFCVQYSDGSQVCQSPPTETNVKRKQCDG